MLFKTQGVVDPEGDDHIDDEVEELTAPAPQSDVSVQVISYDRHRAKGSKWSIEHGPDGVDYLFQVIPDKPVQMHWKDVVGQMIGVMSQIYPKSVDVYYSPPDPEWKIHFYTIRVKGLVDKPGYNAAIKRSLALLSEVKMS